MTLTITIELDNAAFGTNHYDRGLEVIRILRDKADKINRNGLDATGEFIRDVNGNVCGTFNLTEDSCVNVLWTPGDQPDPRD